MLPIVLLSMAMGSSFLQAELLPIDGLSETLVTTCKQMHAGQDRQKLATELKKAIEKHPKSYYAATARSLWADLTASIGTQKLDATLRRTRIAYEESKLPDYMLRWGNAKNYPRGFEEYAKDPFAFVFEGKRESICTFIPLLTCRSPTRSMGHLRLDGDLPDATRVCDMALSGIELLSQCYFRPTPSHPREFHTLPPAEANAIRARIAAWWKKNQKESVADGIRDQLPHACPYWQIEMSVALGKRADDPKCKADALAFLHALFEKTLSWDHKVSVAQGLEKLGDTTPVAYFLREHKNSLGRSKQPRCFSATHYLLTHHTPEILRVLHQLAEQEMKQNGTSYLRSFTEWNTDSVWAIPGVALGLTRTGPNRQEKKYSSNDSSKKYFYQAEASTSRLQQLTGINFGYGKKRTDVQRLAAIKKAQQWWKTEGKKLYSVDAIEAREKKSREISTGYRVKDGRVSDRIFTVKLTLEPEGSCRVVYETWVEKRFKNGRSHLSFPQTFYLGTWEEADGFYSLVLTKKYSITELNDHGTPVTKMHLKINVKNGEVVECTRKQDK